MLNSPGSKVGVVVAVGVRVMVEVGARVPGSSVGVCVGVEAGENEAVAIGGDVKLAVALPVDPVLKLVVS
jgi:hypothetical protein